MRAFSCKNTFFDTFQNFKIFWDIFKKWTFFEKMTKKIPKKVFTRQQSIF